MDERAPPLVSAIVSAYKCERFLRGCLDDLLAQTLGDRLEIVVVDSGSPENERAIVEEYRRLRPDIVYLRTEERETIYAAWNRGIKACRGAYVTNANADDRHRPDALAIMAGVLDEHPDVALVWANMFLTATENQTFQTATPIGRSDWPAFDRRALATYNYVGPQPMWRRALHERYGWFDPSFEIAGDYEFWLRLAERETFRLVPEILGLYLLSPQTAERRDKTRALLETREAKRRRRPR